MARETFSVCDRCDKREKHNDPITDVNIEPVTVAFGPDIVKKDLCRRCRQELGRWINEKEIRPTVKDLSAIVFHASA